MQTTAGKANLVTGFIDMLIILLCTHYWDSIVSDDAVTAVVP